MRNQRYLITITSKKRIRAEKVAFLLRDGLKQADIIHVILLNEDRQEGEVFGETQE